MFQLLSPQPLRAWSRAPPGTASPGVGEFGSGRAPWTDILIDRPAYTPVHCPPIQDGEPATRNSSAQATGPRTIMFAIYRSIS